MDGTTGARVGTRAPSRTTVAVALLAVAILGAAIPTVWRELFPVIREVLDPDFQTFSLASSLGALTFLIAAPLADWKGARPVIVVGGVLGAAGLLLLAAATSAPLLLAPGLLIVASGQFAGNAVLTVLAAHWFRCWRGAVLGLLTVAAFPVAWAAEIVRLDRDMEGWRVIPLAAALAGGLIVLVGVFFLRSHPPVEETGGKMLDRRSPTLERALPREVITGNRQVWLALVLLAVAAGIAAGSRTAIRAGLLGEGIEVLHRLGFLAGTLGAGVAADVWGFRKPLLACLLACAMSAVGIAASSPEGFLLRIAAPLSAAGLGGIFLLASLRFVDAVGVRLLGTLSVAFWFVHGVGGMFAPLMAGMLHDRGQLPLTSLLVLGLLPLVAFALTWCAPFPKLGEGPSRCGSAP